MHGYRVVHVVALLACALLAGCAPDDGAPAEPRRPPGQVPPAAAEPQGQARAEAGEAWRRMRPMSTPRAAHTVTVLQGGSVLVTGGTNGERTLADAEVFDVATQKWTSVKEPMSTPRQDHSATLLDDGRVLVAGGRNGEQILASAEVFDPVSLEWAPAGTMNIDRAEHTATRLSDGRVLIAGGDTGFPEGGDGGRSAEVFLPERLSWEPVGSMNVDRASHVATLLDDGRVLVTGGRSESAIVSSAEIFDPARDAWRAVSPMSFARDEHTATLLSDGRVLVAGGFRIRVPSPEAPELTSIEAGDLDTAEVFDPRSERWETVAPMDIGRMGHAAARLLDGRVLVAGGITQGGATLSSAELFHPDTMSWSRAQDLVQGRSGAEAALLGGGRVLLAGASGADNILDDVELFDPEARDWISAASMSRTRANLSATRLSSGWVLVAGGQESNTPLADAGLFHPDTLAWEAVAPMGEQRRGHTATLLQDGQVLVAGGSGADFRSLTSAEVFDPGARTWKAVAEMKDGRRGHTATLLRDGRVLVAGGLPPDKETGQRSAEIFDPRAGTWSAVSPMSPVSPGRLYHTATRLSDGRVLVTGGMFHEEEPPLRTAEVFDPGSGQWEPVENMSDSRAYHTATLLDDGRVLVAGGKSDGPSVLRSAELFDPGSGRWTLAGEMRARRLGHTAAPLGDGRRRVLVAGGWGQNVVQASAEAFDPATLEWTEVGAMVGRRAYHAATPLDAGRVLVAGGLVEYIGTLRSAEVFRLRPVGVACVDPATCASDFCVDGLCCDRACDDVAACTSCSILNDAYEEGVCRVISPCAPYLCDRAVPVLERQLQCKKTCAAADECAPGNACNLAGHCVAPESADIDKACALEEGAASTPGRVAGAAAVLLTAASALYRRRARGRPALPPG